MSRHDRESDAMAGINAGYAVFQLSRALTSSGLDTEKARERIERWQQVVEHMVQGTALALAGQDRLDDARAEVRAFHRKLCEIRVLDPACGTGKVVVRGRIELPT